MTHNKKTLNEIFYEELGREDDFLFSGCLSAIEWTFANEKLTLKEAKEFEKENGIKHFSMIRLIDKSTGFDKVNEKIMYDYSVWFIKGFVEGFKNPEKYEEEF